MILGHSNALHAELGDLDEIEEECRHALEHLVMLDEHGHGDNSHLVSQIEARRAATLRRMNDIRQELDHAFRR